jgi:hypothetical protein
MNRITTKGVETPQPSRQRRDAPAPEEARLARIDHAIHRAAVAAVLVDPIGAMALLDIPDEELGRLIKNRVWQIVGVATILNIDIQSMREEDEKLRKRASRILKQRTPREDLTQSALEGSGHSALVREGKLLRAEDYCRATGITEKKLNKYLASARIFSVEIVQEAYIPASFLSSLIHREVFAKVIRRLGVATSGLEKWHFFTTPIADLGGSSPLQLLAIEDVTAVAKAAAGFAKHRASKR